MPPPSFPHSRMTTRSFLQHVGIQGHPGVLLGFNASNTPSLFFGSPGQVGPPRPPGPSINFPEPHINFPGFPSRPPGPPGAASMPPAPPEMNYGYPPWTYTQPPVTLTLRDFYTADPRPFTGQDPNCLEEFVASCILKFTAKAVLFSDDGSRVNYAISYLSEIAGCHNLPCNLFHPNTYSNIYQYGVCLTHNPLLIGTHLVNHQSSSLYSKAPHRLTGPCCL